MATLFARKTCLFGDVPIVIEPEGLIEPYRVSRRPHFLGAAVRARRPTPEIEETGMLSRQAAVESRRRPGTEADPSTGAWQARLGAWSMGCVAATSLVTRLRDPA